MRPLVHANHNYLYLLRLTTALHNFIRLCMKARARALLQKQLWGVVYFLNLWFAFPNLKVAPRWLVAILNRRRCLLLNEHYTDIIRSEIGEDLQLWYFTLPSTWELLSEDAGAFCIVKRGLYRCAMAWLEFWHDTHISSWWPAAALIKRVFEMSKSSPTC